MKPTDYPVILQTVEPLKAEQINVFAVATSSARKDTVEIDDTKPSDSKSSSPTTYLTPATESLFLLTRIYDLLSMSPLTDKHGDQLIDRIANMLNQNHHAKQAHAHLSAQLADKNKELSARYAEMQQRLTATVGQLNLLAALVDSYQLIVEHPLHAVFDSCIDQAVNGKGEERHGHGKPFHEQPWRSLADTFGDGFLFGQAAKKLAEAQSLPTPEAQRKERLGAINYIAMGILYLEEKANPADAQP